MSIRKKFIDIPQWNDDPIEMIHRPLKSDAGDA
jgi:hypothetical protein